MHRSLISRLDEKHSQQFMNDSVVQTKNNTYNVVKWLNTQTFQKKLCITYIYLWYRYTFFFTLSVTQQRCLISYY